jgi:hypothetical protein
MMDFICIIGDDESDALYMFALFICWEQAQQEQQRPPLFQRPSAATLPCSPPAAH